MMHNLKIWIFLFYTLMLAVLTGIFKKIMDCLHVLKSSFYIIVITETWADQTNSTSDYNMPGSNVFNTVKINENGGGGALYIKTHSKAS